VYALGVILQELITLRDARSGTRQDKRHWAKQGYLNPLEHLQPHRTIPAVLHTIVATATAADPNDRYSSGGAMADEVRRFLTGEGLPGDKDSRLVKRWRKTMRPDI
jgi:hypothetical protein